MNIFQRISAALKASMTQQGKWFYAPGTDIPMYFAENYENIVRETIHKNAIIAACFNKIVTSVMEAPIKAYRSDGTLADDKNKVNILLRKPYPYMTEENFWTRYFAAYYFYGNAFVQKKRNSYGGVAYLSPIRPDKTEIVASKEKYISYYQYQNGSDKFIIDFDDMMHHVHVDPINDYWGMPVIKAAFRDINTDNDATDFTEIVLQNKGVMPGHIISTKGSLSDDQRKRLNAQWLSMFAGDKRGKAMFVEDEELKVHSLSSNMNELAFPDLRNISEARLCMAFAVPPILIGTNLGLQRSTFSNYAEARTAFYEDTIEPIQTGLVRILNEEIIPEIDPNIQVACDYTEVSAFAAKRDKRRADAESAYNSGIITKNESRKAFNLPPDPKGDIYKPSGTSLFSGVTPPEKTKSLKIAEVKSNNFDQLVEGGIARITQAETWLKMFKTLMKAEMIQQAKDIDQALADSVSKKSITESEYSNMIQMINTLEPQWIERILESSNPVFTQLLNAAGLSAASEIGFDFALDSAAQVDFVNAYGYKFAQKISGTTADKVKDLMAEVYKDGLSYGQITESLKDVYSGWNTIRIEMIARTEVIRAANAGAEESYRQGGISRKVWMAALGDACPFCTELDGKTVEIGTNFIDLNESFTVGEGEESQTMTASYEAVGYPPAHPHCRCAIGPVIEED